MRSSFTSGKDFALTVPTAKRAYRIQKYLQLMSHRPSLVQLLGQI